MGCRTVSLCIRGTQTNSLCYKEDATILEICKSWFRQKKSGLETPPTRIKNGASIKRAYKEMEQRFTVNVRKLIRLFRSYSSARI